MQCNCTGIVIGAGALVHAIILVLTITRTYDAVRILVPIGYSLLLLGSYVSTMINVCLAVVRTIHIVKPLKKIETRAIMICIACYGTFYVGIISVDIYNNNIRRRSELDFAYYYEIINISGGVGLYDFLDYKYTLPDALKVIAIVPLILFLIPCVLPSLICFVCAVIQIASLRLRKRMGQEEFNRRITVTILLITGVFILCNTSSFTYTTVMTSLMLKGKEHYVGLYVATAVMPIINTLANPVILIIRGKQLRQYFIMYLTSRNDFRESIIRGQSVRTDFGKRNSGKENGKLNGADHEPEQRRLMGVQHKIVETSVCH